MKTPVRPQHRNRRGEQRERAEKKLSAKAFHGFARGFWLQMKAPFPLTLALSLGEREQMLAAFRNLEGRRAEAGRAFAKKLETILPLPKGEGRGEGKVRVKPPSPLSKQQ